MLISMNEVQAAKTCRYGLVMSRLVLNRINNGEGRSPLMESASLTMIANTIEGLFIHKIKDIRLLVWLDWFTFSVIAPRLTDEQKMKVWKYWLFRMAAGMNPQVVESSQAVDSLQAIIDSDDTSSDHKAYSGSLVAYHNLHIREGFESSLFTLTGYVVPPIYSIKTVLSIFRLIDSGDL